MKEHRWSRQTLLPEIGEAGQTKWQEARVTVIGAGGLGCPLITALAAAGVGAITVIEGDVVTLSNLNRQYFYTPDTVGMPKALGAAAWLQNFAPECRVTAYAERLDESNAERLLTDTDLVLLAVDNISARLVANRICREKGIPLIDGGIEGWDGRIAVVPPAADFCLACLYAGLQDSAAVQTSIGAVCMTVASLMATAALKLLLGDAPLWREGELLLYDGRNLSTERLPFPRLQQCPVCHKP